VKQEIAPKSQSASIATPDEMDKRRRNDRRVLSEETEKIAKFKGCSAQRMNDSMVYLDGPQIYTCAHCRTHLTSHDDIISKSFHGRHGKCPVQYVFLFVKVLQAIISRESVLI
jgi:hypothetical protein